VEVRFRPEAGQRKAELQHRHFEQHGESGERLRTTAEKPEGWSYVLENFAKALSDPSYPR